uniref:Guanine nucleotide-binding protein alpha-1 subunit n=1 Tax=Paramoeba aestuarina TaxID=180227 RepID=A0A7S4NYP4_9EUKA|mmetsp:Transcript_31667/g.49508  ORF Transcript_31667/g.49508 Transcript_31667/m.49508 type:complete len:363 (+) Transcript_31667:107-1195(+)|eukprot:CAMPEP_0201522380 /NCGR_PEP_ID=MMETSP0161_2-20130828/17178_1 /ASSEMBLY_ACC=CAM_ASM_000251 /TAXON_ID=180227 /ORGANISM="Neoparamoeba aestuarina, Strain SoJaBio B1-5/56/2" /LENGTH=362 /DNA_ID=CAMNT_0047921207 /DNA_START=112 /DNA_END=1200 /DNA_ORIENTATION=+
MGNACSGGGDGNAAASTPEEQARARAIEKMLKEDRRQMLKEVKLLLLGAGQSGKSTLAKQMKVLYLNGFTEQEKLAFKEIVAGNIYTNTHALVKGALRAGYPLTPESQAVIQKAWLNDPAEPLNASIAEDLQVLWADPSIKKVYDTDEGQIEDSAPYFYEKKNLDRMTSNDYCPTTEDVLRVRVKTTGVSEIFFDLAQVRFRMVDVGGQRSERRKWIHCFQDVSAVIFFVAMSEYNQYLAEAPEVKRMHESIALFDEIVNARWFQKSNIILFLNKSDLFKEKIAKIDMKCMFNDYTGGCNFDAGCKFLTEVFVNLVDQNNGKREIYPHVTCATNTQNVKFVFTSVRDSLLKDTLGNEIGVAI